MSQRTFVDELLEQWGKLIDTAVSERTEDPISRKELLKMFVVNFQIINKMAIELDKEREVLAKTTLDLVQIIQKMKWVEFEDHWENTVLLKGEAMDMVNERFGCKILDWKDEPTKKIAEEMKKGGCRSSGRNASQKPINDVLEELNLAFAEIFGSKKDSQDSNDMKGQSPQGEFMKEGKYKPKECTCTFCTATKMRREAQKKEETTEEKPDSDQPESSTPIA